MMRQAALLMSMGAFAAGCGAPTRKGYDCSYVQGDLTLNWGASFDGQYIEYVAEMPQDFGWMAVGFNDMPYMQGTIAVVNSNENMAAYTIQDRDPSAIASTASTPDWLYHMDTYAESGLKVMSFRRYLEYPVSQLPDEWIILAYSATDNVLSQHTQQAKGAHLTTYKTLLEDKFNEAIQLETQSFDELPEEEPVKTSVSYVVSKVNAKNFLTAAESFKAEVNIGLEPGSEIQCVQVCRVSRKNSDSEWEDGDCFGCENMNLDDDESENDNEGYKLMVDGSLIRLDNDALTQAGWNSASSVGGVFEDTTITVEISYQKSNYRTVVGINIVLISCIIYLTFFAKDSDFEDEDDVESPSTKAVPTFDFDKLSTEPVDNKDEKVQITL
eukprot:TRINITY_DN14_c1_g1_i1.p1 TRINITY_DN14_c1_g1~~TRINITY_DN14_c1_g1_i1.p1  ORF type:complete len:408 (+),score=92.38 TRINITY_DN14_c1_g1_i1:73-1224(+)